MNSTFFAQNAAASPKEFQGGKPLGLVNKAGQLVPLSSNAKVYGSFRFAESVTYDPACGKLFRTRARSA